MNPVRGVTGGPVRTFTRWNIISGVIWSVGVTLLGYALGKSVHIDKYIITVTVAIVLLSAIPVVLEWRRQRRAPAPPIP